MVKPVNLIDRRLDKTVSRAAFSALEAALAAEGCAVRITGFWENRTDALQLVVGEADSLLVEELHRVNGLSLPARKEGVIYTPVPLVKSSFVSSRAVMQQAWHILFMSVRHAYASTG